MMNLVSELALSREWKLEALLQGVVGYDVETGATLMVLNGRVRTGSLPRYILTVPISQDLDDRGKLFSRGSWQPETRKFIRAESDTQAVDIAHKRITQIVKRFSTGAMGKDWLSLHPAKIPCI
jgi:hypothetical protein